MKTFLLHISDTLNRPFFHLNKPSPTVFSYTHLTLATTLRAVFYMLTKSILLQLRMRNDARRANEVECDGRMGSTGVVSVCWGKGAV